MYLVYNDSNAINFDKEHFEQSLVTTLSISYNLKENWFFLLALNIFFNLTKN